MDLNVFPIVENKGMLSSEKSVKLRAISENEMLIGTVTRGYLLHVLEEQVVLTKSFDSCCYEYEFK